MNKKLIILFSVLAVNILFVSFSKTIIALAWGDNSDDPDMRPSYTNEQINSGILGDTITINSISDNELLGDEKNFVSAREHDDADRTHLWQDDEITVEDGKEYTIRMFVYNNNPGGFEAIAKGVRAYFQVPNDSAKSIRVRGYLDVPNATPTMYWDHVDFNSDTTFHLELVGGSGLIFYPDKDDEDIFSLSDNLVTNSDGVLIGYDSLNGEIPGGFEFRSFVMIRVRAYYDTNFTVNTEVRIAADTDKTWKKSVDAKIDDKVEFQMEYRNTDTVTHNRVVIRDILPANLKYVPGSTKVYNGLHPSGMDMHEDDIVKTGIIIGNYEPKTNAYIRFTAEVVDETFTCGLFTLRNWGRATVGSKLIQDSADVNVQLAHCPDVQNTKKPKFLLYVLITINVICVFFLIFLLYKLYQYRKMK